MKKVRDYRSAMPLLLPIRLPTAGDGFCFESTYPEQAATALTGIAALTQPAIVLSVFFGGGSMEKLTTFRFFEIDRLAPHMPKFVDRLNGIFSVKPAANREKSLGQDYEVRLERLSGARPGYISGQMIRIQRFDYPGEVLDNSTTDLPIDNPLGHGIVFLFNVNKSILGIQSNSRILSVGRFIQYVNEYDDAGPYFTSKPILRPNAWERFAAGGTRKVTISVASPDNLELALNDEGAAAVAIKSMAEAYDAPKITIEVSMGRESGFLNGSIKKTLKKLIKSHAEGTINLEKAEVKISGDGGSEVIDLLADLLDIKKTINFHSKNIDLNYELAESALVEAMHEIGY
ncbi:MAG: hypothetical protein H6R00_4892 [Proteobacteria bacterium]|nr:hypothetical protein [Pseudomonadota bacterium]